MVAYAFQLVDFRAAMQQEPRGFLLLFESDRRGRQRQQSGCAARDQTQHQISRAGLASDFRDALGAQLAIAIRYRMPAFIQLDAPQASRVAILSVDEAAGDALSGQPLDRVGHLSAGFPRANYVNVAKRVQAITLAAHTEDITRNLDIS